MLPQLINCASDSQPTIRGSCGTGLCINGLWQNLRDAVQLLGIITTTMSENKNLPLVLAITGATGVIYGVELLRVLRDLGQETHLILREAAGLNLSLETGYSISEVKALASVVYNNKDVGAALASGSFRTRGMIVAPC